MPSDLTDPKPATPHSLQALQASGARAARGARRRLRLALYVMLAVMALAVVAQGLLTLRQQKSGADDDEVIDRAGQQGGFALQIGRQVALWAAEPAARERHRDRLDALLTRSAAEAFDLDAAIARQIAPAGDAGPRLQLALEAWTNSRERLWYRAQAVLRLPGDADADRVKAATAALQSEVEPALATAQGLAVAMRQTADQRGDQLRREMAWGMAGLLLLMGLLSLTVVEPTARSVSRHARRLAEQSAEVRMLALVAEHTTALVTITDSEDRIQWVNAAFTRVCGWSLEEAVGRRPPDLMAHPNADTTVERHLRAALEHGHGVRHEWLRRTRDGREVWLDIDLRPLRDEQGALSGFIRVATDVSARVQQQSKLLALWAALPAGVVVHDADGAIVDANREAERLLGLSIDELQGRDSVDPRWCAVREDLSPYPGAEHPAMRTLRSGVPLHGETMGVHLPGGELRWLLVNTEPRLDVAGHIAGVVSCFSDITERRLLQDRLTEHVRTDELTGLPNRLVVMERLQRAIRHARRHAGYGFAVLFMDFDRFKQVNDTLGHSAGDDLLRQIAARLLRALRPGDAVARVASATDIAARLGGDEFVVVLEGVHDRAAVEHIAARLSADLAEPYLLGSTPVQSSVSMGVVLSTAFANWQGGGAAAAEVGGAEPDNPATIEAYAEQVLRNADTAMYEAKRAGRGRWVIFDNSMHERVVRAMAMENDLRRALRNDELFVVYQPVMALGTRQMVGAEALVRWRHPQRGLVPPIEFIGVAEECGLIDAVGATVLRKACGQFMAWQRTLGAAAPRQLAVNLSRAQLKRLGLVDEVSDLLQELGMSPACLELEVTESLAAQDEPVLATLHKLKALGTRLALDDFGTGYSSLACLHLMPVDTVKIDRSFVSHAETVDYHRVLIEATIRVARTLGMVTVAEGIETEGQAALMQHLECDRGQGYLFSRPLDAEDFEAWVRQEAEQLTPV
ncbi:EAL domain-containing protein [Rubrivivax sp. A210]|uniref:EAL domain-containing protein n=1 Tax=Rubrivivax sp. A210 TaxID=2772301 RepID=UPI00191919AF|nr:EAL domain-containing protein [Rubrivivax sp. A210]